MIFLIETIDVCNVREFSFVLYTGIFQLQ